MLGCETHVLKMYELVLFKIVFIQLFSGSFGSFFMVFPSRRLSITFDIQIYLKMKRDLKP